MKSYIFGSGGLSKEVFMLFFKDDASFAGYIDEDENRCLTASNIFAAKHMNLTAKDSITIAIGDPATKERISKSTKARPTHLIHDRAIIGDAKIDFGCIIFPNVTLTANVKIGKFCTIYQNSSISHDSVIGDYCNITPGVDIAGRCKIGNKVYLGIGCTISNDITICDNVIIGAGATVVSDITEPGTYVGTPARRINK